MVNIIEIKARTNRQPAIRDILEKQGARFVGEDQQVDTYFRVSEGRLKLRAGLIENTLIFYQRDNQAGPKLSKVLLHQVEDSRTLLDLLSVALGKLVVVDKKREIWFLDNIKVHLDFVSGLGTFVEIEAIDEDGTLGMQHIDQQCRLCMELFGIEQNDLISNSYSDLILAKQSEPKKY